MHFREIIRLAVGAQFFNRVKPRGLAGVQPAPQLAAALLDQVIKRAVLPTIRGAVGVTPEFQQRRLIGLILTPAKAASLIDGMQRIDDDDGAAEFEASRPHPLAKAVQEREFGGTLQARRGDPGRYLLNLAILHEHR